MSLSSSFWPWVSSSNWSWVVHKFGGTSVANAECFRKVADILDSTLTPQEKLQHVHQGAVVSAMGGVTDALLAVIAAAQSQSQAPSYKDLFADIMTRHYTAANALLAGHPALLNPLLETLQSDAANIGDLLRAIFLSKSCSDFYRELIVGHGEIWSTQILCAFLISRGRRAGWLDARQVLVVDTEAASTVAPPVDWQLSQGKFKEWFQHKGKEHDIIVITGFIAATSNGTPTTLKRNGSDYSGSIFGNLMDAQYVTIWTDVDGVYSADPRRVPSARLLPEMTYTEAIEMSFYGAKIIHPKTMAPAVIKSIPIFIRNTFNPECPGTKIHLATGSPPATPSAGGAVDIDAATSAVRGLCSIDNIALINVRTANGGDSDYSPLSVRNRLLNSLKNVQVPLVMIAQAAPDHTVSFCVPEDSAEVAKATIVAHYAEHKNTSPPCSIELLRGFSILTAVGDRINQTPGIAAKFFSALARHGVNVLGIAQNGERIVCVIVERKDCSTALRVLNTEFTLSQRVVSVGIIGSGTVGGALLRQLDERVSELAASQHVTVSVRGVLRSKTMTLTPRTAPSLSLDLSKVIADIENANASALTGSGASPVDSRGPHVALPSLKWETSNLDTFVSHIASLDVHHAVLVDCTSDASIAALYPSWLARGIHIVTPNKKGFSGDWKLYRNITDSAQHAHTLIGNETTVGAALPILGTLRSMVDTGDAIKKIEGVFSGTLSYIFANFSTTAQPAAPVSFSSIVQEAKRLGYTEPNPKDDLTGSDVARKVCILGRLCGLQVSLDNIAVHGILPKELLEAGTADEFMGKLPSFDAHFAALHQEAASQGAVLRFVGVVDVEHSTCKVELRKYAASHPFASLRGGDNIVGVTSKRYPHSLVIQGPGAGAEVTASGVFADLLSIVASITKPRATILPH